MLAISWFRSPVPTCPTVSGSTPLFPLSLTTITISTFSASYVRTSTLSGFSFKNPKVANALLISDLDPTNSRLDDPLPTTVTFVLVVTNNCPKGSPDTLDLTSNVTVKFSVSLSISSTET